VVAGQVLACKWVRLACKRHLEDLARERREFAYRFDSTKANRVCRFIELLPHVKGQWARPAPGSTNRIKLEAWQLFWICCIFGWIHKASGLRRFTDAYICIPRKNAKSTIAAAIGLYMLAADGEYGAEVYSGATTEKQAWEVFRPAWRMVKKTPDLLNYFGVESAAKSLYILDDGGRFEPVIGDPGDGASPSCAIVDEFHEHTSANLRDTMKTGMGSREQPLLLSITTAGSNIEGPCHDLQSHVQKVLEGLLEDDSLFGIIHTIDEGDDWTNEAALRKANPNFGVSVLAPFLAIQQREAVQQASKQNIFKTKHLNIWVNAATAWMNMESWGRAAEPSLKLEEFVGQDCYEADDLSAKIDIAARVQVFIRMQPDPLTKVEARHFYIFGAYYLPEARAMEEGCQHYQRWVHEGLLTAIPGAEIQFGVIRRDILADCKRFNMRCLAFDPWGAQQLQQELASELPEDTVITIPQQTRFLSEPMKEIEAALLAGRLHHNGDKLLSWMVSNVVAKVDANGNLFPRKERAINKIDGAVAMIMAVSRAMVATPKKRSVYSSRGLLTV
jgi:phage terminase large subunit-like protein